MALRGVRVGPLDPDATAEFGQVAAKTSARTLVRHHAALHPPALVGAMNRTRNDARSDVLDPDEVHAAVVKAWEGDRKAPETFEIVGPAVRGTEDAEKVVTFVWRVPVDAGGSGRTGKGFIPYTREALPNSFEAGDENVMIEKLKEAGLPWHPSDRRIAAVAGGDAAAADDEFEQQQDALDDARAENERLSTKLEALRARIDELDAAPPADGGDGGGDPAPDPAADAGDGDDGDGDGDDDVPSEPWPGYDDADANAIKKYLRNVDDDKKVAVADAVLRYEPLHGRRASILAAANQITDRQPSG